jgi:hypothetical protein
MPSMPRQLAMVITARMEMAISSSIRVKPWLRC